MERVPPSSDRRPPLMNMNLLVSMGSVTPQAIEDLERHIDEPHRQAFERLPSYRKAILVALFRLGEDELIKMRSSGQELYLVGIHDMRAQLIFLFDAVPELNRRWHQ